MIRILCDARARFYRDDETFRQIPNSCIGTIFTRPG
jgi:hypothetical protein